MQTGEVGIDVTIDCQVTGGFDNHSHVLRAVQITDNGLDCTCMRLLWIMGEPRNLTDRIRNVWSCVCR